MVKRLLFHLVALMGAVALTAHVVPDVEIDGGLAGLLSIAVVFAIVNAVVAPVLRLLTMPLRLATVGLFSLVVNGLMFSLVAGLSDHLSVGGPMSAVTAALVVSAVNVVLHLVSRLHHAVAPR